MRMLRHLTLAAARRRSLRCGVMANSFQGVRRPSRAKTVFWRLGAWLPVTLTAACAASPTQPVTSPAPTTLEDTDTAETVAADVPLRCEEPAPVASPPSVLLALHVPPPPPPPPRRGERRIIELECMDCMESTDIVRVAANGAPVTLGPGVDPRMLPDGSFAYAEEVFTPQQTLVRVAPDGTVSRTPGGATLPAGVSGMLPLHRAPRTPDGRLLLTPERCDEHTWACQLALYRHGLDHVRPPLITVPFSLEEGAYYLALAADGSAFSGCVGPRGGRPGAWLWVDVASGETWQREVSADCAYIDVQQQRALTRSGHTVTAYGRIGAPTSVEASVFPSRTLLSACGDSVFVAGRIEGPERGTSVPDAPVVVERISLDGGERTILATWPTGPYHDVVALELDERGWLMVLVAQQHQDAELWLVPTSGPQQTTPVALPSGRVYMAVLGPQLP